MAHNVTLLNKDLANGQTRLKFDIDGVIVYRTFSKELKASDIAKIKNDLKQSFKKTKKPSYKETPYGHIKKEKEQDFNNYLNDVIKPMIEAKRSQLNV